VLRDFVKYFEAFPEHHEESFHFKSLLIYYLVITYSLKEINLSSFISLKRFYFFLKKKNPRFKF